MKSPKKILVADDDEAIVDSVTMLLEMNGYEVIYVKRGKDVKAAIQKRPDLLILDIWMSGTDGRDVCKELKSNDKTKDLPILMMSASRDIQTSAIDCGANDFIAKPFEMSSLIKKIETLTSQRQS